ncbi:UbiA-like polyprenyltransferase [Tautonia sociabilis]|uniref:4-hydroxybenzoate polyprenyltransferase n=1 Tax=Tautonia sociabilis TaxID=2080755 RepID=A0A432MDD6_9BACT|nr:4-hydroxybenzoate octaprenyltransferase [Tautonia sociabilis]
MTTEQAKPLKPLAAIRELLGLVRFSHTLFALPFALLGAAMAAAGHRTGPKPWLGILLCMVTARSAAMAFNRLVDRHLDARNPRTATRHLPSGRLSVRAVTLFTIANAALFVASTALFLPENPWPVVLSVPVLLWLLGYSYAKRFTSLAHYWLGAALAMAPIAAWIAIRGDLAWPPVLLGLAVLCWVGGFDIIYACQDAAFDRQSGLRSIPARLGVGGALRLAAASHAAMVVCLVATGLSYPAFGLVYWVGVATVAVLLSYEHAIVREYDLGRVNVAFFYVNIGISLGLLAIGLLDLAI